MKTVITKANLDALGFTEHNGIFYPRNHRALATIISEALQCGTEKSKSIRKAKKRIKSNDDKIDLFVVLVKNELGLTVVKEHLFHPVRKWRFDFAIIDLKIAVEVEGGVFSNGRHTRGSGFIEDCNKYNQATSLGWRLIRVMPSTLMSENTLELIRKNI
jgi:very-short-patch-repair endonuclease